MEASKERNRRMRFQIQGDVGNATLEAPPPAEEEEEEMESESEPESTSTPEVVNWRDGAGEAVAPAAQKISSATAGKMWSQAKQSAIDATFQGDLERDWGIVLAVWSAGTYARFLKAILSRAHRDGGRVVSERDGGMSEEERGDHSANRN